MMELAEMSLTAFIEKWSDFTKTDVNCIAQRLMWGLSYLHSQNVIHRDVKVPCLISFFHCQNVRTNNHLISYIIIFN